MYAQMRERGGRQKRWEIERLTDRWRDRETEGEKWGRQSEREREI